MIKKCIYCSETDPSYFKRREHVIPEGFGTFDTNTPTLHCVCDKCNEFFGKELELPFARETLEGIARYTRQIYSGGKHKNKKLKFSVKFKDKNHRDNGIILQGIDGTKGELLPPFPQLHIFNRKKQEYDVFLIDKLKKIKFDKKSMVNITNLNLKFLHLQKRNTMRYYHWFAKKPD